MSEDADTIQYGLLAGKPYDGTTVNFVICCRTAAQFAAWQASVPRFTELTGIKVNFTNDPLNGLREKLVTQSVSAPGSWDAALYFDTWMPQMARFLEPLNNVMPVDMSDYPDATSDLGTWDGKRYGIPARSHVMMLYYRTDVFNKLNLEVPKTYKELLQTAKTISESDLGIEGFTLNWAKQPSISPIPWISLIKAGGGKLFDASGNPQFANPEIVKATKLYRDLTKYAPKGATAYNEADARHSFAEGEAAMTLAWSWSYEVYTGAEAESVVKQNVGYTPHIPGTISAGAPIAMTWPIGISNTSTHKGAAAEWVKWVTNTDMDQKIITDKSDPKLATVVANRISSMESDEANAANDGFSNAMAKAFGSATHQPIYVGFAAVTEIIEAALSNIISGADIESTLESAARQAANALKKAKS